MNDDEKTLLLLLALDQCQHFPRLVQIYQHLLYTFALYHLSSPVLRKSDLDTSTPNTL